MPGPDFFVPINQAGKNCMEKTEVFAEIEKLEKKVKETTLPPELREKLEEETLRLRRLTG